MPSIDGLISGINSSKIIEELLTFQRQPIQRLQDDIKATAEKKTAILNLTGKLLSLQGKATALGKSSGFQLIKVASSNETVLAASGTTDLTPGSYRFKVRQLAQVEQYTSVGFASSTTAVGAGTLTIETGNGFVDRKTELEVLNGGAGVRRGSIRITNRAGTSAIVDLSTAVTIDDVIESINNVSGLNVTARLATTGDTNPREALVLTDSSGGSGTFKVEEVSSGNTARDLGMLKSAAATTLQGDQISKLGGSLKLSALNDGLGVRLQSGNDLLVTQRNGNTFNVDLGSATTLQEVLDKINNATGNQGVTVSVSSSKLVATDSTTGATTFSIANVSSGSAATDLGLTTTASGGTITGKRILADLNSALLKTLKGGSGIGSGSIKITNRSGTAQTLDLSSAQTIREVIDTINTNTISVTASFNATGNGLLLTDASGGTGSFKVEEVSGGTTANDLGILQASGVSKDQIAGGDVNPQYIGLNTLLATLNAGRGVFSGSIRITDGNGKSFTVDLSQEKSIGEVIEDINGASTAAGSNVTAAINTNGNGIKLTSASGSGTMKVEDINGGTTAKDLNILGSAPSGTPLVIDGAFEKSITISSTTTLDDLVTSINNLGLRAQASVVKDGSSANPYRLQVSGSDPGALARVAAFTSGGTSLEFTRTSAARDAIVFYGSTENGSQPLVVRSGNNVFSEIVKGLTVTAKSPSSQEVVVSASRNIDGIKESIEGFVELYNKVIDDLQDFSRFDAETGKKGVLFGDGILRTISRQLANAITRPITGLPATKNLASNAGLRIQASGKLVFKADKFDALIAADPSAIENIFTQHRKLEDNTKLKDFGDGEGVKATAGAEFKITVRSGASFTVDFSGASTVKDLYGKITDATSNSGKVTVSTSTDGRSIVLTDATTGSTTFKVESQNESPAYRQLGLDKSADVAGGDKITGRPIDLTDDPGIALRVAEALKNLLDTEDGSLTRRSEFYQGRIDGLKKDVKSKEEILGLREATLRREFAQLEILLGQNQNLSQRLSAGLGGAAGNKK
ncbi:MAG: flagellar filament capping protein FliD [Planctomycetes bacterium]|nr:flagellar filament capping protein FliD [Planctomycetota bacterium]